VTRSPWPGLRRRKRAPDGLAPRDVLPLHAGAESVAAGTQSEVPLALRTKARELLLARHAPRQHHRTDNQPSHPHIRRLLARLFAASDRPVGR
jgi:hypothetical protein